MANENSEIRYLNPPTVEVRKKKYCRFKKAGIKYVDYKDPEFLKKFLNEQGKILPRRITGTSLKFQRKVALWKFCSRKMWPISATLVRSSRSRPVMR